MLLYVAIFSLIELKVNKHYRKPHKEKSSIISLLLLHNIIYVLIYFTILFIIYYWKRVPLYVLYAYVLFLIYIPIHWYKNDNKCWFTLQQNKLLGLDEDVGFRDFISILTNTFPETGEYQDMNMRDLFYYSYIVIAIIITIFIIVKREKRF